MEHTYEELDNAKTSTTNKEVNKDLLEKHTSPKKLKFKCPFENCDVAYRKNWLLEDHILKHNKQRPFKCTAPECSKTFTKDAHLKRHKVMVHEKTCEEMCDFKNCGKVFNNKYSLKKHKTKVHVNKYFFICPECSKGFLKRWHLTQHMFVHTGEPPFKCNKCNIGFLLSGDLTKHNRNHKTYTCGCGELFEKWSKLRAHKKDVCKLIEKKCKNCGTLFTNKHNLHAHYKICSSKFRETFQCPYLNCTKVYQYNKNLNWHIRTRHEMKTSEQSLNFVCPVDGCERAFSHQHFLNSHIKKHKIKAKAKPKDKKAPRKDKGTSKTYLAATLSGIKLSQREHLEVLKGNKNILNNICKSQLEDKYSTVENSAHMDKDVNCKGDMSIFYKDIQDHDYGKQIASNEQLEMKLDLPKINLDKVSADYTNAYIEEYNDCGNDTDITLNSQLIESDHDYGIQFLSDDMLLRECNLVLNKLRECLA